MRQRVRSAAASSVQPVLRRLGFELTAYPPVTSAQRRRQKLLRGRSISLVLDVGANAGQYGSELRADDYRGRIVSFEPLDGPFRMLKERTAGDSLWDCHQLALGDSPGSAEMNVAGNSWSSSLLGMESVVVQTAPDAAYVGTTTVPVETLDTVSSDLIQQDDRVHLKLDVQGYELHALRGASACLERVELVEVELSLTPIYTGGPLYRDVIDHLDSRGYDLVGIDPEFEDRESGVLLQANGMFARRS